MTGSGTNSFHLLPNVRRLNAPEVSSVETKALSAPFRIVCFETERSGIAFCAFLFDHIFLNKNKAQFKKEVL